MIFPLRTMPRRYFQLQSAADAQLLPAQRSGNCLTGPRKLLSSGAQRRGLSALEVLYTVATTLNAPDNEHKETELLLLFLQDLLLSLRRRTKHMAGQINSSTAASLPGDKSFITGLRRVASPISTRLLNARNMYTGYCISASPPGLQSAFIRLSVSLCPEKAHL